MFFKIKSCSWFFFVKIALEKRSKNIVFYISIGLIPKKKCSKFISYKVVLIILRVIIIFLKKGNTKSYKLNYLQKVSKKIYTK